MLPFVIFYGLQDVLHEKVLIFPFNLLCFESRRTNKKQQYEVLLFAMQPWSLHSNIYSQHGTIRIEHFKNSIDCKSIVQ